LGADEHPGRKIGPLAVNISPTFGMDEMKAHLDVCSRYGVRIIVTSVGDPTVNAPLIQGAGILHFHDATTIRFAEKAAAAGVLVSSQSVRAAAVMPAPSVTWPSSR